MNFNRNINSRFEFFEEKLNSRFKFFYRKNLNLESNTYLV